MQIGSTSQAAWGPPGASLVAQAPHFRTDVERPGSSVAHSFLFNLHLSPETRPTGRFREVLHLVTDFSFWSHGFQAASRSVMESWTTLQPLGVVF